VGGVPPQNQKRGRVAPISTPTTSGTQNAGKPSANGGGQRGSRGAQAPWRGSGGCAPFTPTEVSLFEKGRPSPTLIKVGVEGAAPTPRGHGRCAPKVLKEGESSPLLSPRHEWGPKRWQALSPRGWARGSRGAKPPWRGVVGGVPPQNQKRERVARISNPATSGAQNSGKPSAHGGGQNGGSRGAEPPWRGSGGCAPFTPTKVSLFEKGRPAPTLIKLGVEGAQAPSQGVWGMCPQKPKLGNGWPALAIPPRVGPKTLASPQLTRVGKGGPGGRSPLVGGIPQKNTTGNFSSSEASLTAWPICFAHACML